MKPLLDEINELIEQAETDLSIKIIDSEETDSTLAVLSEGDGYVTLICYTFSGGEEEGVPGDVSRMTLTERAFHAMKGE